MRFDIAQIQRPMALEQAKDNLRNRLAAVNDDLLLWNCRYSLILACFDTKREELAIYVETK